eukprot:1191266-Prorocentrum_minimum.AAC.2
MISRHVSFESNFEEEYPAPKGGWARCEHHDEQLGPGAPRPCRRVSTTDEASSAAQSSHPRRGRSGLSPPPLSGKDLSGAKIPPPPSGMFSVAGSEGGPGGLGVFSAAGSEGGPGGLGIGKSMAGSESGELAPGDLRSLRRGGKNGGRGPAAASAGRRKEPYGPMSDASSEFSDAPQFGLLPGALASLKQQRQQQPLPGTPGYRKLAGMPGKRLPSESLFEPISDKIRFTIRELTCVRLRQPTSLNGARYNSPAN